MNRFLVFDVESIGLHGEGFAVGAVLIDRHGAELNAWRFACPPTAARGNDNGRAWVSHNIPPFLETHKTPREMRDSFWRLWLDCKNQGAALVSDCGWPVEARFLAACVDDKPEEREWGGPYPLFDLASIAIAKGDDPLVTRDRLSNELPAHDPLADARQSARLFVMMMRESY